MEPVLVPMEDTSTFLENVNHVSLDVLLATPHPAAKLANSLFSSKETFASQDVVQDTIRTDLFVLPVQQVVLCAKAPTFASSVLLVNSVTKDSVTETAQLVHAESQDKTQSDYCNSKKTFVLNATLLARPVPNIPANVLHARAAAETSSTTSVLKSVQLELMPSTEHVNIVLTIARPVLDPTLPVLPAPTEKFSTQDHAMINVPT